MDILPFFLPMVAFLGIVTSYEDAKIGIIRNKWVVLSLAYSFIMTGALSAYFILIGEGASQTYVSDQIMNVGIAFLFGFFVWKAGFWSAGDAKLFLSYAALVPLSAYFRDYVRVFPSFTLFVNTLFFVFVFLVASLVFRTSFRQKREAIKRSFNPKVLLFAALSLFGLSWLIEVLFSIAGIGFDMFSFIVIVPFIYIAAARILKGRMVWLSVVLATLRIILDHSFIFSVSFVYRFIYIIVFYVMVKYFLYGLSYEFFSKPVPIEKIRAGMMLSDNIYKNRGKYEVRPQEFIGFPMQEKSRGKLVFGYRCLTGKDVDELMELHKKKKIGHTLRVQSTMPFAIFMFLGVIASLIVGGNVIILIKVLTGF